MDIDFFFFLLIDKFSSNAYYSTACVFLRVSYSLVVSYSTKKVGKKKDI